MSKPKPDPELIDDENPEWTDEMFARARPAAEVLGEAFMARARKPGRPKAVAPKKPVTLRLDVSILARLRAGGAGWQTRVNKVLGELIEEGRL